jgi:threonylcarbamoyladenosine tRNA methylthiotransferase MtaB
MKIFLDTVGCRLNQSEIEGYAAQFHAAGHGLVHEMNQADLMVLNSCAVTAAASSDSRQKIRQANKSGIRNIIVTGCMSTLSPTETLSMDGVTKIIPNQKKDSLVENLLQISLNDYELEPIKREPIPGSKIKTRAYIKVQDGCNNRCTFCITTVARGEGRSKSIDAICQDINFAEAGGALEVVLTGVHLGSWGYDFNRPKHLKQLIEAILERTTIPRIRVSSLEPWDLVEDFFELWNNPRMCRHLHLPLQSGSKRTLRRMARNTTPKKFANLVENARHHIPDVAITTDLILGFPGETDEEFLETKKFVKEMEFASAHVFTYSERAGTAAAIMLDQVVHRTRKERSTAIREITTSHTNKFQERFIGKNINVLWESIKPDNQNGWKISGLSDNYLRVNTRTTQPIWNQITPTQITKKSQNRLIGEIITLPNIIMIE